MEIFITGSSGYIGSELIKELSNKHEIVEYDLENGQDILDYDNLKEEMKGCDVVVHLAAIRGPYEDKSLSDYFRVNCRGTRNVAKAAEENNIERFIYSSSTSYYGLESGIPYVRPLEENNPIITQHVKAEDLDCRDCDIAYSTSKVIAEQILANYGLKKKLQVLILRLGPVGGKPGESWSLDGITLSIENAVEALIRSIETEKKLWYEAFTITDGVKGVNISKARNVLGYEP